MGRLNGMNARDIALRFNDAINTRDVDRLGALMTDDHRFVDSEERAEIGKEACLEAWRGFFQQFPDYRNVFTSVLPRDDVVVIAGYSTCSFGPLDGPALWKATIRADKVAEWRVYQDDEVARQALGLSGQAPTREDPP